jgi:hypothetical protein
MGVVDGAAADGAGNANVDKGAGAGFEHVCKVFGGCNETSVSIDMRLADEISRSVSNDRRLDRIIDERGEYTSGNPTLAVAPKAAATPAAVRRMRSSIFFIVSLLTVRNVPRITAVCGITL